MSRDDARLVVERAVEQRVFPGGAVQIGSSDVVLWQDSFGRLTFQAEAESTTIDTLFDLASLTKVIATTSVAMELVQRGEIRLEDPVSWFIREWRGTDRTDVTIRDLLEHTSGLPARLLDAPPRGRREFEHEISTMPLQFAPRTTSLYSDLGFILLGFVLADCGGQALDRLFAPFGDSTLTFELADDQRPQTAPTVPMDDDVRRGRTLRGEVHDSYASQLGGVAGHAGLFGSAPAVGRFARSVLQAARGETRAANPFPPDMVRTFVTRSAVRGSSRALGWDTMLPTSSCGTKMSAAAFGHVGFTGTSLWIDPERDRYFVLLTNRACGGGSLDDMRTARRAFHDALGEV